MAHVRGAIAATRRCLIAAARVHARAMLPASEIPLPPSLLRQAVYTSVRQGRSQEGRRMATVVAMVSMGSGAGSASQENVVVRLVPTSLAKVASALRASRQTHGLVPFVQEHQEAGAISATAVMLAARVGKPRAARVPQERSSRNLKVAKAVGCPAATRKNAVTTRARVTHIAAHKLRPSMKTVT